MSKSCGEHIPHHLVHVISFSLITIQEKKTKKKIICDFRRHVFCLKYGLLQQEAQQVSSVVVKDVC